MTWVIAIAGFCALIVAHEAGHFIAAKAVGMRVERFSLFFPPKLVGFRRGETDYQIGMLPLGGYVKITGMTPDELASVDLRVAERSYYMKEPWKRIVVILAGPGGQPADRLRPVRRRAALGRHRRRLRDRQPRALADDRQRRADDDGWRGRQAQRRRRPAEGRATESSRSPAHR